METEIPRERSFADMEARASEAQQRMVESILRDTGEPRVVLVENGELFVNDFPIQKDEETQRVVMTLLRARLCPRNDWVEVGPMMLSLRGRRHPVVGVLGADPVTGHAKVQVRLAMGRSARYFLDMPESAAKDFAISVEARRRAFAHLDAADADADADAAAAAATAQPGHGSGAAPPPAPAAAPAAARDDARGLRA